MKKFLIILFILLLLTGCTKSKSKNADISENDTAKNELIPPADDTTDTESDTVIDENSEADPSMDEKTDFSNVESELLPDTLETTMYIENYLDMMDDYEVVEIAFLGTVYREQSLDDVLTRSANVDFGFIPSLPKSQVVYGEGAQEAEEQFVYLVIPSRHNDLSIGKYDMNTKAMSTIYYKAENSYPVIFIEKPNYFELESQINVLAYTDDEEAIKGESSVVTGFYLGKLRTNDMMGTVDMTNYELIDPTEIPFIEQTLFDDLLQLDAYRDELTIGEYTPVLLGEEILKGHNYYIYQICETATSKEVACIAVSYDVNTAKTTYLWTEDYENWQEISTDFEPKG